MMADGHLGKCKDCARKDVTRRAEKKSDEIRAYDKRRAMRPNRVESRKKYSQTERGKAVHAASLKRSAARYPERRAARIKLSNAVRDGRLIKKPCEVCGNPKSNGHHAYYSKPFDVQWLFSKHHAEEHRRLKEEPLRSHHAYRD